MFSSSEADLKEPLRNRVLRQPRNFEERFVFGIENPPEFRGKYRLSVDAIEYIIAAVDQQLEEINLLQLELTQVVYKGIQVTSQ